MPEIEIDGLDELQRALRDAPEIAIPIAKEAMFKSIAAIEGRLKPYPPSTDANRPGRVDEHGRPMGFYERGRGWWYPVMQRVTLVNGMDILSGKFGKRAGRIKAKKAEREQGVVGYKLRATSEDLKGKWAKTVRQVGRGLEGIIGNTATYKDYVVGMMQAKIHAMRGWTRVDRAIEESIEDIEAAWSEALDKLAEAIANAK